VALVIVCVPEGLPLALSMALAFSIDKLKTDNLLIKSLKALEATGSLTNIMTGKTATLTEGKLTPKSFISIGKKFNAVGPELNSKILNEIQSVVVLNTEARMEIADEVCKYIPMGSPTEVGMLNYLIQNNIPI